MASSKPTGNTKLPDGIEVFRVGTHVDDAGVARTFTRADIDGMAAAYDPALREAPLTIGHPKHDLPAYGGAESFTATADGRLLMNTRHVEPQFAEMVRTRRFPKRSLAFYTPDHPNNPKPGYWYPRHAAFLGAQPPAIAGLADIPAFADSGEGLVCFSEATPQEHDMSKELQDQLAAEKATREKAEADLVAANKSAQEANEKLAQFAEGQRKATHAAHVQFAEGAMKEGKLKKPDVAAAVAVLDLAAASAAVQFSEGDTTKTVSPVEFIKGLISAAKPLVQFSEQDPGNHGQGTQGAHGRTDAELDADAKAYAKQHNVQYAEALSRVASFTSAV